MWIWCSKFVKVFDSKGNRLIVEEEGFGENYGQRIIAK